MYSRTQGVLPWTRCICYYKYHLQDILHSQHNISLWATNDNNSNLEDIKHWHRDNRLLLDFLFLSTSGAAASFLIQFKPKRGELANRKAAWDGMVRKHLNSTRQRRCILKHQLSHMVMTDEEDPDVFINEVYYLRDELADMQEVFNDDSILDIVLEGLTDEYLQIKYSAEADDDFALDRAVNTMRNMYATRAMRNGPLRKAKGRESAMVVTSTPSAVVTCSLCKKPGHRFQNCFKRKGKMSGKKLPPAPRNNSWCSLHNTDRHDNSDCRSQMRDDNITRRPRPGQRNGRHYNNRSAHANTATTPISTTQMEAYVPVTHAPSTTAAATTAATSTSFAIPPCPS